MGLYRAIMGDAPGLPVEVGQAVFLRCGVWSYVGRVAAVTAEWLTLEEASWVADAGRQGAALRDGPGREWESEPYPDPVTIPVVTVQDVTPWRHPLPREAI